VGFWPLLYWQVSCVCFMSILICWSVFGKKSWKFVYVVTQLTVLQVSSTHTQILDNMANKVDKQGDCDESSGKTKEQDNPALLCESIEVVWCD
jgi:hypothetical protein